ncbi:MAG: hypothetical protein ABI389_06245 [Rhodanobacter sp.]
MLSRIALLLLGLALAGHAIAGTQMPARLDICRQSTPTIREMWLKGAYDAPPAVARLMVNAIDGKLPEVRRQLQDVKSADASRWRQTAMLTAAWAGQSVVVDGLLDDGAAVDGDGQIPPFKPGFFDHTVDAMEHDSRFGGPTALKRMRAAGVVSNQGRSAGPALITAAECGDLATLDVLLRHHANLNTTHVGSDHMPLGGYVLLISIVNGNPVITQRLLDYGAHPCAFDRWAAQFHLKHPTRPVHTLAEIGRHAGLPAALVTRLTCPARATAH